ncbi:MAG: MFS transporter [Candidatus Lokiarchaeota archaeon]|nr:MFS transporter [Candidatus Lokiarchaeota archaeon]
MEYKPNKKSFRNYIFFWSGQLFSLFGSMVVYFVIIWWITEETQSPVYLAIGSFLFIICQVIFMPIAGVLADRLNRKVIIVVADSLQAFTTLLLLVLFQMNLANVWTVLIFIGVRSIFQAFHLPAVNSIIPAMVPKENLSRINGINFLFTGVVQIIAPLTGATLMILLPINTILWVDVITFFIALIPLVFIKIPSANKHGENVEKKSFFREFKQGLQTIKVIPGLVTIIFLSMLLNFLMRPFDTLMPYYINVFHGGSATHLAIVLVFFQGGMIFGALITSIKKTWKSKMKVIFGCISILMMGYGIMALAPPGGYLVIGIGGVAMGLTLPIINALYQTFIQTVVPAEKMGRITSIDSSLSMSISPIGTLISGPLAEVFGVGNLFLYCAILGMIVTLLVWSFTGIKNVDYDSKIELEMITGSINSIKN